MVCRCLTGIEVVSVLTFVTEECAYISTFPMALVELLLIFKYSLSNFNTTIKIAAGILLESAFNDHVQLSIYSKYLRG